MKRKIPVIICCLLLVIVLTGCGTTKKQDLDTNNLKSDEEETKKELTESEKMIYKVVMLMDEKLAFDTGNYIKGDIPTGEYAFIRFDGSGQYYSEEDESGNIIDNENFDSFGYVEVHEVGDITNRGLLVNVTAFEKLGVGSAKELYEILNEKENYFQSGFYKVGVDIQPGTYILESIGSGYYAVLTGAVGNNEIVNNDSFNGKVTVNLSVNQYLDLSRAKIVQ